MMPDDPRLAHDPLDALITRAAPPMGWWEHQAVVDNATNRVIGWITWDTPDDGPEDVKRGFTARRVSLFNGGCGCGGEMVWDDHHGTPPAYVNHRPSCPGHLDVLAEAIERWERGESR